MGQRGRVHEYILIFSFYLLLLLAAAAAAMVMFMVMVVVGAPVALTIRTCALGVSVCQKFDNESAEVCLSVKYLSVEHSHPLSNDSKFHCFGGKRGGTLNSTHCFGGKRGGTYSSSSFVSFPTYLQP